MMKKLCWILPLVLLLATLADLGLIWLYEKFGHPWREIIQTETQVSDIGEVTRIYNRKYCRKLSLVMVRTGRKRTEGGRTFPWWRLKVDVERRTRGKILE